MTIREAVQEWVRGFNKVDIDMIRDLWGNGLGDFCEITPDADEYDFDSWLPYMGMWTFNDMAEVRWLENEEHLRVMAEYGFRIFDSRYGYFFGIQGCGYDFYEAHWIPLYKAMGLHWHDITEAGD